MVGRIRVLCLLCVPASALAGAHEGPFSVTVLPASVGDPTVEAVASGRMDDDFAASDHRDHRERSASFRLRLEAQSAIESQVDKALAVRKGRHLAVRAWDSGACAGQELMRVEADGVGAIVAVAGHVVFLGAALYTLIVAFMAWQRGSRPASWSRARTPPFTSRKTRAAIWYT